MTIQNTYDVSGVQIVVGKDSLLTLDEEDRGCQEESQDDCNTKKYLEELEEECKCLPFQLRFLVDKVYIELDLKDLLTF